MLNINTNSERCTQRHRINSNTERCAQRHRRTQSCPHAHIYIYIYAFTHRCRHAGRQLHMHALFPSLSLPLGVSVSPSLFFSSCSERKKITVPRRIHDCGVCMDSTILLRLSQVPHLHQNTCTCPRPWTRSGCTKRRTPALTPPSPFCWHWPRGEWQNPWSRSSWPWWTALSTATTSTSPSSFLRTTPWRRWEGEQVC